MKASQLFKLLLLIALAAWMHILASPAEASVNVVVTPAIAAEPLQSAQRPNHLPETSSVVLISALGVMLMLRRRRLHV